MGGVVVSFSKGTDIFIVGGGPAGLAVAIAARQHGMSVIVADGTEPPVDKACGEGLMPETLAALGELGVEICPEASSRFRGIRFFHNDVRVNGDFSQGLGLGIRRTILHEWLIARAEACGVRLLWRTPVTGISPAGVRLSRGLVPARWIVGADGTASRVRAWSGLNRSLREKQRYAIRRHYAIAPWAEYVEFYWGTRAQAYVTPVSRTEVCVVVAAETVEHTDFDSFLKDCPQLHARLARAELTTRERGAVTLMHSLVSVHSGNVALLGDASGGVDAITGEGLRLAFRQAISLASAMRQGDLRLYSRAHRALARKPMLMGELLLLLAKNPRLRARTFGLLAAHPQLFTRMLAFHSGNAAWEDLLSAGAQLGWRFLVT